MMGRTAIYICDCMGLVSDHVDTKSLERLANSLDDVVLVKRQGKLCGKKELDTLSEELKAAGIEKLLFAGCSPRMSLKLPEERLMAAAHKAGVESSFVEVANIREQCAWIHRDTFEGASRKARDILRMAHARLMVSTGRLDAVNLKQKVLVIGAGPAGLAAASHISKAGFPVALVERNSYVGGAICQTPFLFQSECWPSTCESKCVGPVQATEVLLNPLVELHTAAEVEHVQKQDGNFFARIKKEPCFVDPDLCISCGLCEKACPEELADSFEFGRTKRKAISKPFPRAMPDCYTLYQDACTQCEECVKVCPTGAIDLAAKPTVVEETVGSVILATGAKFRDAGLTKNAPNVVTALEFERLLARGLARPSDGEVPEHIVFVQCAGSRVGMESERTGVPYCSKTCCAVTAKQVQRVVLSSPMTEVSVVYYRDFRTYERALEKLYSDLKNQGITFLNGEVTAIEEKEDRTLAVQLNSLGTEELEDEGAQDTTECDLVVLACAQEPQLAPASLELGFPTDIYGFPIETQPRLLRPTETFVDRVFAAGVAVGPKTMQQSVEQGAVAAQQAVEALSSGKKQPQKFTSSINQERCSRCGVCLTVCPHGAIRMTDHGALADEGFCQGCGLCAASCSSHAASLRNFSDQTLLSQVREAFVELPENEPRLLAMLCYWCGYGGADLAGSEGLEAPDCFRTLRIRCSSSVNLGIVLEMFRMGVDGIVIGGCPENSCHHMWGNWMAHKRINLMRKLMRQMGMDERRLVYETIGIPHSQKFVELLTKKRKELLELGQNPWRRTNSVIEGAGASWLAR